MAYCSQCGKELFEGEIFCSNCGTRVDGAASQQAGQTQNMNTGSQNVPPAGYTAQTAEGTPGYYNMLTHVLLLIFTLGIWQFIWIYKTTQFLNCVQDEPPRNPTTKLLLCIFVTFYTIYWVYKHARYIDSLAASKGIWSDLSTVCLVMMFFVPIVPPLLMQDKLNNIVTAH